MVVVKRYENNLVLIKKDRFYEIPTIDNVLFTCGAVAENNETSKLYWRRVGTVMGTETANVDEFIDVYSTNSRKTI